MQKWSIPVTVTIEANTPVEATCILTEVLEDAGIEVEEED